MGKFRLFTHLGILATTPSFLIYPQDAFMQTDFHVEQVHSRVPKNFRKTKRYHLASYDDILKFVENIESGAVDYREKDLRRINRFLTYLASESVLPNSDNAHELKKDIDDLLEDSDYAFTDWDEEDFAIIPAVGGGEADILLCRSKLSKKWKKTKKFIKKHKKEIIIGAVIVVATATVVIAVVATSTAGAAAAAAGAAGAASSSKSDREDKSRPPQKEISDLSRCEDTRDVVEAINEAPAVKATIDEHVDSFKELVSGDVVIQSCDVHSDPSFSGKAKELSSMLAHETLDGISEIASIFPQLGQEINDLSSKFLPENVLPSGDNPFIGNPKENYENFIAKSHEAIDWVFSTEQADQYTPEAKANDPMNDFTIGLLPPPGNFSKGISASKFRKIIGAGKETTVLAEELGFTAKEIVELEKAGKLEGAIDVVCENWLSKSPSEAYIAAKNGGRHARIITEFGGKPVKEIQKSVRSYEKLIVEHKDKIANPSKYCPGWDTFHPNRQKALVEKIWPNEIQCYTEQMDILQNILYQKR